MYAAFLRTFRHGVSAPLNPIAARRLALTVTMAFALALLSVGMSGQGRMPVSPTKQPKITALVTDNAGLALSPNFGTVGLASINQHGDLAFVAGSRALFVRGAGATAPTRLLQMGDPAPGFADTRCENFFGLFNNGPGKVAFSVEFTTVEGMIRRAIYVWDASGFTRVAYALDAAPGEDGKAFGRDLTLLGIDDAGVVAFSAPLVPVIGYPAPVQTTLYLWAGGETTRLAGPGDTAPDTGGGVFNAIVGQTLSSEGEVLFTASVVGGSGFRGLFAASKAAVRKIVSHGDSLPMPLSGSFDFSGGLPAFRINNVGQAAFGDGGRIYVATKEAGVTLAVQPGDVFPASPGMLGGTIGSATPLAVGAGGHLALTANVSEKVRLLRYTPGTGLEVVAYPGMLAPGAEGATFNNFPAASLNASGLMTFYGPNLNNGLIVRGFFQQRPGNAATKLVLEGEATPLSGGGRFGLALSGTTETLDSGAAWFFADVLEGTATAGTFLASGGSITSLSSTEDPLPAGSRVSMYTFGVGVGGDIVVFRAGRTGGQESLWLCDLRTGRVSRIMADGDTAPGTGGRMRNQTTNYMMVNAAGDVAFMARLVGGTGYGGVGIFLRTREGTLKKIVAQADTDAPTSRKFAGIAWNYNPSPLNAAGQVVFRAMLSGSPSPNPSGVFVGAADAAPTKVVLTSDALPPGLAGTYSSFGTATINNGGAVAFSATLTDGRSGVFFCAAGTTPVKIAASGDPGPSGSAFPRSMPNQFIINDLGEVAFMSALDPGTGGGPDGGLFLGTSAGGPVKVVLNGDSAPSGGSFAGMTGQPNFHLNNAGDLVLRTGLTGTTADSGLFVIRRADGVKRAILVQGQDAPGTGATFDTLSLALNNVPGESASLTPDGEVWTTQRVLSGTDDVLTLFRFGKDNQLERVIARGDKAPQRNGGTISNVIQVNRTGVDASGLYYFWARIIGGKVAEAIYVTR